MKQWLWAVMTALFVTPAAGADRVTLLNLAAGPPTQVVPLPSGTRTNVARLTKVVIDPDDSGAWAILYWTAGIRLRSTSTIGEELVVWNGDRSEARVDGFARIFAEEMARGGVQTIGGSSLFTDEGTGDLQVGVRFNDMKGRFCADCPNLLNPTKITAVVTMGGRWEVYSALRGGVIATIQTRGGVAWTEKGDTVAAPVIYEAFRENVRQLLASEPFRAAMTSSPTVRPTDAAAPPLTFARAPREKRSIASATESVVAIFSGDGHGTGFLVSAEGYVLTNHHVVNGAKYVKVRWPDRSETLGEVVRFDQRRDVALVKVEPPSRSPLAYRTEAAKLGEGVFAIGTPLDTKLQGTVTKGIVSSNRNYNGLRFIQSDVSVNPGNSGGPLLDEAGSIIGVTVSGRFAADGAPLGLNLFIPIEDALSALGLTPRG